MAKKRKMTGPSSVAKKRRGSGGGNRGGKENAEKDVQANAFETVWTRKKFDVLGKKKKKGEQKRVGLSRSLAVEKRKKTLLQEYKQQGKGNVFLDRRFGEADEDLPEEDRAILRFQKERQSQINRKSKFTLADDDDEEETLTHRGMALSTVDDFKDSDSLQDDDENLADLDETVGKLNFGGGFSAVPGDNSHPQQPKSKKEIMEEIIAKSKQFKAEKAREKEDDLEIKEKLDNDFSELIKSGGSLLFRPTRKDALRGLLSKSSSKGGNNSPAKELPAVDNDKPDDFDKLIKEMVFDMRGHAGDRLKTTEEILKEERERLEELEKKRKKRMLGIADSEEEGGGESDEEGFRKQNKRKRTEVSGDDLGENFQLDEEEQEGKGWVDEVLARKDDEDASSGEHESGDEDGDSDEDGDEATDNGDESADEWSEDEDLPASLSKQHLTGKNESVATEHVKPLDKGKGKVILGIENVGKQSDKKQQVDDLPFVIDAPQTLGSFRALIDDRPMEDLAVAIQRIRACNAISLAAENRKKMQVFYNVLLQYFGFVSGQRPFSFNRINLITKPLIELSSETPYFAAHCARQRLIHMHGQLTEKLKRRDGSSCWPSLRGLFLLRFWSMIFPPSDFRHPVMTPAVLLMAGYLMRCKVTSARDIAVGSFLCNLLFSVLREARRFCPEVLCFILALLVSAIPKDASRHATSLCPDFMVELVASNPWLQPKGKDSGPMESFDLDFVALMTSEESARVFDSDLFRLGILQSILETLRGFVGLYGDIASFPEIFTPLLQVLKTMGEELCLPEKLDIPRIQVLQLIEMKIREGETSRQPLRMRLKKPTPIKQFNPKFEEDFVQGRSYDPDRERAEKKKLQRQVKREAKGAARELRKDNYFILEEKQKEKAIFQEEQKEKYGKAMQFLQEQESAFKSGQLGKGKGRRKR